MRTASASASAGPSTNRLREMTHLDLLLCLSVLYGDGMAAPSGRVVVLPLDVPGNPLPVRGVGAELTGPPDDKVTW